MQKRMREEVSELEIAMSPGPIDRAARLSVINEAADVANFAMMIADNWHHSRDTDEPPSEPAVISGPNAIAIMYDGTASDWEASRDDDGDWYPFSEWMTWDHYTTVTIAKFRRRQPDPFAGIDLPEGYRVELIDGNKAAHVIDHDGSRTAICASDVERYRVFAQLAKRLRELEAAK